MGGSIDAEIDRNYAVFRELLPYLMQQDDGRFALFRRGRLQGIFDSPGDADRSGFARFEDGIFSIQRITDQPIDLGFYSHGYADGQD